MSYEPKSYKIKSIKEYSPEVKLFKIDSKINPSPGQFFQVSVLGKGEVALASCSYEKEYVDVLVRKVGNVTSSMFKLKEGDSIFIRGPYGKGYNIESLKGKDLILVAGGTGVAPITSLIEYISKNREDFGKVLVFFAFRDDKHILLHDRIKKWSKMFEVVLCLDKKSSKIKSEVGFVHQIIEKYVIDLKNPVASLCGPEIMMSSVSSALNNKGIDNNRIFWNMERRMECAIGSCGRCLLQDLYVCRDGPVFIYSDIKEKIENEAAN